MRKLLPVVITTLLIACSKNTDHPNEINSADRSFIVQTFIAARNEITAGELTTNRSSDPVIKNFARELIADYTMMQEDLIAVVNKIDLALADTVLFAVQAPSALSELSGYAFDTAYMNSRVESHLATLKIFQDEMNNGNNTYLRYYFLHKHMDKVKVYYLKADSIARLVR
jgi:putative membrane protein